MLKILLPMWLPHFTLNKQNIRVEDGYVACHVEHFLAASIRRLVE
jgi:hypothetical protein